MKLLRRTLVRIFNSLVLAAVTLIGAPLAFGATVLAGLIFLPLPASIPLPRQQAAAQLPTVIYDRFGNPVATLSRTGLDVPFSDAQVPQVLEDAVISDEDRNYFHENGVDLRGLIRAAVADIRNQATVQGGSTIAEQYVKLVYTGSRRTLLRKIEDAVLASQLTREASKKQILYRYMTIIYLGDGNTGVAAAAQSYFHVPLQDLDASQAATVAGLIPAPSARAPEEHLGQAEHFREVVLGEMFRQHYLTEAQYRTALAEKLAHAGTPGAPSDATLVYPEQAATTKYPDFVNYVELWLQQNLPRSVLAVGGLRVQTTLDPTVQQDAYSVVGATLDGSAYPVDMALAAVQPQTGFVEALVGGRGFGGPGPGEQVNLALGGCPPRPPGPAKVYVAASCWSHPMISAGGTGRQPGSAYKPFTLAAAFEDGIPPSTVYSSPFVYQIPGCIPRPGQPADACQIHNDVGDLGGPSSQTLAAATARSINTVYAQVAEQVTCPKVARTARDMGVQSAYYSTPPFFYCASYPLGEVGVSPLDMASAYGVFADHGQRAVPTPILEIVNGRGKVLVDNISRLPRTSGVLPANVADNVTSALEGVITAGTGTTAQIGRPAAGKTGTTSDNTDAWFVGYTPTLSTAVWMGDENSDAVPVGYSPQTPKGCVTGHYYQGGTATFCSVYGADWPAITWKEFMQLAVQDVPVTPFSAPAPILTPQEAQALMAPTTTTTLPVEPGYSGTVAATPLGGPYEQPAPQVTAPPPPPTTSTAVTTTTSTSTTTVAPPPSGGSTTTTAGGLPGPGP